MADDIDNDPALKNFNEGVFTAKYVAGKTLKYGAIGAVVGGGLLGAGALAFSLTPTGMLATAGTFVAGLMGVGSGVMGAATTLVVGGAAAGGVAGAAVGAGTAISSADEAVAAKQEELRSMKDRMDMRIQKSEALKMQHANMRAAAEAQAASLHVTPPQALPTKTMDGISLP